MGVWFKINIFRSIQTTTMVQKNDEDNEQATEVLEFTFFLEIIILFIFGNCDSYLLSVT